MRVIEAILNVVVRDLKWVLGVGAQLFWARTHFHAVGRKLGGKGHIKALFVGERIGFNRGISNGIA